MSINELPDEILVHIISSLPTIPSTVETSFVCKKWRNLWLSTKTLFFSLRLSSGLFSAMDQPTIRKFAQFIDRCLILRSSEPEHSCYRLVNFHLQFNFNDSQFTSQINSWIRYAVSHRAMRLFIQLCEPGAILFDFYFSMLGHSQSRVRALDLRYCNLHVVPNTCISSSMSGFCTLCSISLEAVVLSDQMIVDLMMVCVNLESLFLLGVLGCKHIKIHSSKLKELVLKHRRFDDDSSLLEINAPNLLKLTIDDFLAGNYAFKNVSCYLQLFIELCHLRCWIKFLTLLGNVKRLTVNAFCLKPLDMKGVNSACFRLQNLESVEIQTHYNNSDIIAIVMLLKQSPSLQTLILNNHFFLGGKPEEIIPEDLFKQLNLKMPSLKHLTMKSFVGLKNETRLLDVLTTAGSFLQSVKLIPRELRRYEVCYIERMFESVKVRMTPAITIEADRRDK